MGSLDVASSPSSPPMTSADAGQGSSSSSSSWSHPEIFQPGYVDATSWLRETCARLAPAQMVHTPHFSLLDSMGAIQAMEPRMDSGIYPLPDHLVADSDRPPESMDRSGKRFSPYDDLDSSDVCWIMDRILAAEVAWHRGGTLSQTLCTSLFAHQLHLLRPVSSLLAAPVSDSRPIPTLVRNVLHPYLVGVLKSTGLAWDELIRGNVVDGEDFSSDPAGLDLQAALDPEEVVEQIEGAMLWVSAHLEASEAERDALITRLSLRRSILLCLSRLTLYSIRAHRGAHDLTSQVVTLRSTLSILEKATASSSPSALRDPSLRSAPSAAAFRSFDPHFSRRIASAGGSGSGMPPPKPVQLGKPEETLRFCKDLAEGLDMAAALLERPSWTGWKRAIVDLAVHFQRQQTSAYLRSIVQSITYQERGCVFSLESLDWIAESFILDVVGVPFQLLALAAQSPTAEPGTGAQLSLFSERLASQLVNFLCALSQNRARGKRVLGKLYTSSVALAEEASQLGQRLSSLLPSLHPDLLFAALQHLSLSIVHLTLSANLELSLLSRTEWAQSYWLLARVLREQLSVLRDLRNEVGSGGVEEELQRAGMGGWRGTGKRRAEEYLDAEVEQAKVALLAAEAYHQLVSALDRDLPEVGWPCKLEDVEAADKLSEGLCVPLTRPDKMTRATSFSRDEEEQPYLEAARERRHALRREVWCKRVKWLVSRPSPSTSTSAASREGSATKGAKRSDNEEALILWAEYDKEEERLGGLGRADVVKSAKAGFEEAWRALEARREGAGEEGLARLMRVNAETCLALEEGLRSSGGKGTIGRRFRLEFEDERAHPWYPVLVTLVPQGHAEQ